MFKLLIINGIILYCIIVGANCNKSEQEQINDDKEQMDYLKQFKTSNNCRK